MTGIPEAFGMPIAGPALTGDMTTVGFIGSGNIGGTVARRAVAAGYDVVLSNSRGPQTLKDLVEELGPRARAAIPAEAAAAGDLVVVSIPLRAYPAVPVQPLAGKPVLDTINYIPQRDGRIPGLDGSLSSSEVLQRGSSPAIGRALRSAAPAGRASEARCQEVGPKRRPAALSVHPDTTPVSGQTSALPDAAWTPARSARDSQTRPRPCSGYRVGSGCDPKAVRNRSRNLSIRQTGACGLGLRPSCHPHPETRSSTFGS